MDYDDLIRGRPSPKNDYHIHICYTSPATVFYACSAHARNRGFWINANLGFRAWGVVFQVSGFFRV